MSEHIRTKWHRLRAIAAEDDIYITAPQGGRAHHWNNMIPDREAFKFVLDELERLPRFVVDSDVLELVMANKYQYSLADMKEAGVCRLPYPAIMVEFAHGPAQHIVLLRDLTFQDVMPWEQGIEIKEIRDIGAGNSFYGIVFRVDRDADGEYVVMGPSHIGLDIAKIDGEPNISLTGFALGIFRAKPDLLNKLTQMTMVKDAGSVFRALASAMLVMHTEGIKREVVTCEKINRTRGKSNKPLIPRHTILSIGRVYRSSKDDTTEAYDKRRSPIPHWRRGHIRSVRYGVGRSQIRTRYIPPRLVAFKEFEGTPEPQQTKTYKVQK